MDESRTDTPPGNEGRSARPTTEVRWLAPGVVLVLLGGEHDLVTADELERVFDESLEAASRLIVDLSGAEFVDSSTIRVIFVAKQRADRRGCRFSLVLGGTAPVVENALQLSGALPMLERVETLEQALADDGADPGDVED